VYCAALTSVLLLEKLFFVCRITGLPILEADSDARRRAVTSAIAASMAKP
jgi:hypothetical protein